MASLPASGRPQSQSCCRVAGPVQGWAVFWFQRQFGQLLVVKAGVAVAVGQVGTLGSFRTSGAFTTFRWPLSGGILQTAAGESGRCVRARCLRFQSDARGKLLASLAFQSVGTGLTFAPERTHRRERRRDEPETDDGRITDA